MEKKKQREKSRTVEQKESTPHSTVKSFKEKGTETRELHQKYKKLEQDWNAFKESRSTISRKYRSPLNTVTKPIFQNLGLEINNSIISPKELMFSLQRDSSSSEEETWKNYDVAARETLEERREAIERGKLKGRRLFDSTMESDSDDNDNNIGQKFEVRSFCYSEDEHEHENESLSSSLSPPIGDFVDKDMVTNVADMKVESHKSRVANGTRYTVFLGGFVAFALLMVAMCISLGRNFWGHDLDVILVPT